MVVKKIDDYDTVFLCDIHAPLRNRLFKILLRTWNQNVYHTKDFRYHYQKFGK